jgi:ankyrin repeat protein
MGHLDVIEYLWAQGAELDSPNHYNETPLHVAVECNKLDAVRLLCDLGASTNKLDSNKETPLDIAILYEKETIVEFFITQGVHEMQAAQGEFNSPLHLARQRYNNRIVTLLMQPRVLG